MNHSLLPPMRPLRRVANPLLLSMLGLLAAIHARADSVDGFTTSSLNAASADQHSFNNTSNASMLTPTLTQSSRSGPGWSASGWGQASLGHLATYSSSSYPADNTNNYVQDNTQVSNQLINATVVSGALPLGTPADLLFTMNLNGTSTDQHGGLGYGSETVATLSGADSASNGSFTLGFDTRTDAAPSHQTFLIHSLVGSTLTFTLQLSSFTYVSGFQDKSLAVQNFALDYYIDSMTPGVQIHSATGYDFSSPAVPEPATCALMLAGLAAIGLRRART